MQPVRRLGSDGPEVGSIGYGAMVLSGYYGGVEQRQAIEVLTSALDSGATMIDTADAYGDGANEELLGLALRDRRDEAFVATKFGIVFDDADSGTELATGWGFSLPINGKPEYAARSLEKSLKRLGFDHVDLWYLHYPDPQVEIEETVAAMAQAVSQGKARYLGLSNVTADQVRRAHTVHPITAVQFEYSLWRREPEADLLPTLRELGIAMVPWSPLGSGFLTGQTKTPAEGDFRSHNPKYQGGNAAANRERFAPLNEVAAELDATPAQLALAWLLHQGDHIVPIPGTRQPRRVAENIAAASLRLSPECLDRIDRIAPPGAAKGETLV